MTVGGQRAKSTATAPYAGAVLIAEFFVGLATVALIGALLLAIFALSPEKPEFGRALTAGAASAGVLTIAAGTVAVAGYLGRNTLDPAWATVTAAAAVLTLLCIAVRSQGGVVVVAVVAVAGVLAPLWLLFSAVIAPHRAVATSTPAEILTGRPLPAPLSVARLVTGANLDPLWLAACACGLVFYLVGVWRAGRRGDAWSVGRTISWVVGILVLAYATSGGLALYARYLLSAQLAAHLAIASLVPLLLTPAAPVALLIRSTKRRTDASRGPREWALLAARSRVARFLARPVVSGVVFSGSLWAFYYSSALRWATESRLGGELADAYFVAIGCLFVRSMLGARHPRLLRLIVVLAAIVLQAAFGVLMITTSGLFFADWFGAMGRTWGALPIADQRTAGLIALTAGELPLIALGLMTVVRRRRIPQG